MASMTHRRDENGDGRHFRSDRCVLVNGAWFVATREGVDVGPYPTRTEAEAASARLAQLLVRADAGTARRIIQTFTQPDAD
jgi:hypothetical protein